MKTEDQIVEEIVSRALAQGYTCYTDNGDGLGLPEQTVKAIANELTGVDESTLHLKSARRQGGFIFFVFGNSPEELVCDYTLNPDIERVLGKHA